MFAYLAIAGPGLIAANAGNDAAGIATYSSAGSQFVYRTLFFMVLVTVALVLVHQMSVRLPGRTRRRPSRSRTGPESVASFCRTPASADNAVCRPAAEAPPGAVLVGVWPTRAAQLTDGVTRYLVDGTAERPAGKLQGAVVAGAPVPST